MSAARDHAAIERRRFRARRVRSEHERLLKEHPDLTWLRVAQEAKRIIDAQEIADALERAR